MLDDSLAKSSQIKHDFLVENRALIERVDLCLASQPATKPKFLVTLPCFDNNIWISYPELEELLVSRMNKSNCASNHTKWFWVLRSLKRSILGVFMELLVRFFSPGFRVRSKVIGAESKILGFTYSKYDPLDNNFFSHSKFWGPLPGWFKSRFEITWLGLDYTQSGQEFENDISQIRLTFRACLKFLGAFGKRWRFWRQLKSNCSDIEIFSILKREYRRAIIGSPAFEAEYLEAMFVDQLVETTAKTILIPHENQLWERVLCMTAKQQGLSVMGFLHTTPRFWDLRFFDFDKWDVLQPDLFISGGKAYKTVLLEGGVSTNRILNGTALRFQHLATSVSVRTNDGANHQTLRVLVVTGVNKSASIELIKLVSQASLPGLVSISIRPHPENLAWIKRKFPKYQTEERNFEIYLNDYNLFVTDSVSSLGLEFAYFGRRTAVFVKRGSLNFSPLFFFKGFNSYFWDAQSLLRIATTNPGSLDIGEILDLPNESDLWLKVIGKAAHD